MFILQLKEMAKCSLTGDLPYALVFHNVSKIIQFLKDKDDYNSKYKIAVIFFGKKLSKSFYSMRSKLW